VTFSVDYFPLAAARSSTRVGTRMTAAFVDFDAGDMAAGGLDRTIRAREVALPEWRGGLAHSLSSSKSVVDLRRRRHLCPVNRKPHDACFATNAQADTQAANVSRYVRFGSKADICSATGHVRFTPNSDRKSRLPPRVMSALPLKADI
jgi:hypothetical protein